MTDSQRMTWTAIAILAMFLFTQGIDVCDIKGRDCIERSSTKTFNCSIACMGIYADVHHGRMIFLEEEKVNRVSKNSKDKEKYKKLIAEYRKFKAENVKHFRLNVSASLDNFGRLRSPCITTNLKSNSL